MKSHYRLTALLLAFFTVLPLVGVPSIAAEAGTVLFSDDFERFSDRAEGTRLTRADGFANQIPSTSAVAKEEDNTYLRVDFTSSRDPNETVYYMHNSSYELVSKDTPGAVETDAASYGLISGSDGNINKNLQLKTPLISYAQYEKIFLEVDYYLSEDANGSIHSQILRYSSAENASGTWLGLYNIDSETGVWNVVGGSGKSAERLTKGAWNRLGMVIDLKTGMVDCYLNNVLYAENFSIGQTNLIIHADSLIVGKIHRTQTLGQIASDELNGYFGVDNVRISVFDAQTVVAVPTENELGQKLSEVEIFRDGEKIGNNCTQRKFLCTNGYSIRPVYFDATPYEGMVLSTASAELRMDEVRGMRYVSELKIEKYEALEQLRKEGKIKSLSIGTMIVPRFHGDVKDVLESTKGNVKVLATYGAWYSEDKAEEGIFSFAGSLVNIRTSHCDDAFIGVGYVAVTLNSGAVVYYHGDYDRNGTSLATLARETLSSETLDEETKAILQGFVATPLEDVDGNVREFSYLGNRLFFRIGEDISACLSYAGENSWRLRAHDGTYLGFEDAGAAQALAGYMNETPDETCEPLTMVFENEALTVSSTDSSYVKIWFDHDFEMRVYNALGDEVIHLTDISVADGQFVLHGALTDGEAVFGGGERFDSVNQRGKTLRLYSKDGWNDSASTYMVIPMFSTSRGGGFFINRYEDMLADIGDSVDSEWKLTLKNNRMDCYFFATESIKEVITGYTRLTGNAETLPEEWSYGVMICRYGPDFDTFEKDLNSENRDGAPAGNSIKTITTNLIEAGMKPSALVLESFDWLNISQNTESARASREELRSAIEWLDSLGIRVMLYTVVGGSYRMATMEGVKEEYFVHAYVNDHGNVRYTNQLFSVNVDGVTENPDVSDPTATRRYLDITNPEALEWYYDRIWGQVIDMGIDGVKIDFAEQIPDEGYDYGGISLEYDWYDPSKIAKGGEHHSYPVYFISSFYQRMNELKRENGEDDGFFVLSRGGGIGSQRNPYLWAGDQCRTFDKLDDQLMAVVNCGLSGVPFMTYDMAGYRYGREAEAQYGAHESRSYESELFALAISYSAFMVNIQTHGTVRNAYELSDYTQDVYRWYLDVREDLLWYIDETARLAATTGIPAVRHPVLEYQYDPNVYNINDQFLLGDALMVAPILSRDTYERTVYLPKGSWTNLMTGEVVEAGYVTLRLELGQVGLFLNNDSEAAARILSIFEESEAWASICTMETTLLELEYQENFDRFAACEEGTKLTRSDGFTDEIPSSTAVARDGENTYLRVDLAAAGDTNKTVYYLNDKSAYPLVSEDTDGALSTDEASYGLISGNDGNINKNLTLNSPQVSYTRYRQVSMEVDYYLSEDADGSITVQMKRYSCKESNFENTLWLSLYEIDMETGALRTADGKYGTGAKLKKGAWNNIQMVIDLDTGEVDYYLNGELYSESTFGKTCLTLISGNWVIGKISRTKNVNSIAAEELDGYFCVDNVKLVAEPKINK